MPLLLRGLIGQKEQPRVNAVTEVTARHAGEHKRANPLSRPPVLLMSGIRRPRFAIARGIR